MKQQSNEKLVRSSSIRGQFHRFSRKNMRFILEIKARQEFFAFLNFTSHFLSFYANLITNTVENNEVQKSPNSGQWTFLRKNYVLTWEPNEPNDPIELTHWVEYGAATLFMDLEYQQYYVKLSPAVCYFALYILYHQFLFVNEKKRYHSAITNI